MRFSHFMRRGSSFCFVCRVPRDIQEYFPKSVIWTAIKARDEKTARTIASGHEYLVQRLFSIIRTAMFPKDLQDWMISAYLEGGLEILRNQTFKQLMELPKNRTLRKLAEEMNKIELERREGAIMLGRTRDAEGRERHIMQLEAQLENLKSAFYAQEVPPLIKQQSVDILINYNAATNSNIKPTRSELESFGLRLLDAEIKMAQIEHSTVQHGSAHFIESELTSLKSRTAHHYMSLQDAVTSYLNWYRTENSTVKTIDSEVVPQCNMLLELLGADTSIAGLNSFDAVTDLIGKLQKYPKNKVKLFGDKSFATILRSKIPYEPMGKKTGEKYLGRLRDIIKHLIAKGIITDTNKTANRHVLTKKDQEESAPDTERLPYDKADMVRLVDALCTRPLYTRGEERNERFWLVLIGILHGVRTGNITGLTKAHVVTDDAGVPCFDFTQYTRLDVKTADARRNKLAISPALIELGFLDWVESLNRAKLFRDSQESFSRWYNRDDLVKSTGIRAQGFEAKYITTDRKKCFYSQRHNFQGACEEAGIDFKYIKQMVGHKQDKRDQTRSRYTPVASPAKLLSFQPLILETFKGLGLDLARLRYRAIELFPGIQ